jgi:hypothetical protein
VVAVEKVAVKGHGSERLALHDVLWQECGRADRGSATLRNRGEFGISTFFILQQ